MNVLILEDENLAAEKLEKTLLEVEPSAVVVARLQTVAAAVEWLENNPHPDLILTDIRLLDGLCFDIFEQVRIVTPVIFTTAYDHFAIRAFEVNSIDYLLKPVVRDKLKISLQKLKNITPKPAAPAIDYHEVVKLLKTAPAEYKSRFMVRLGQKIIALPADKIA